jgi:hypothetical protein
VSLTLSDLIPIGLILVVLSALNFAGVVFLGSYALRYRPAELPEPLVEDDRLVGGEWRQAHATQTAARYVRESEFRLPSNQYVNGVVLLPRFARAALAAGSMSREVLLSVDCHGRTPPDNDTIRDWHADIKALFLDAGWATPGPGGGIVVNRDGREALVVIADEGEGGLIRLLRRIVEQRLASAGVAPSLDGNDDPNIGEIGAPTETRNLSGRAFVPTPLGRNRRDN